MSTSARASWLLGNLPEFRNVFYYRLRGRWAIGYVVTRLLLKPMDTLSFWVEKGIGPGLFIQHGFATIVVCEEIGSNCWINQQVTIGHVYDRGSPRIGNNVTIGAGAVVVGPITIGDGATIGANATVTKDVPAGAVAVGNPARLLGADAYR